MRWLRTQHTDQWQKPWPNAAGRNRRVRDAIRSGRTWIAWDGTLAVATITVSPNHHAIWPEKYLNDPAVYVRRLVVSRRYPGLGLGAQLLEWAGLRAAREYGARWIRADVWKTNTALHDYYRRQGFEFCEFYEWTVGYPSSALFQKPTDQIEPAAPPLFHDMAPDAPLFPEISLARAASTGPPATR